jgi:hypothetical protein
VTGVDGAQGGINHDDEAVDAPGWGLPTPDPTSISPGGAAGEPPLTEVQREVIEKVAEAQRELGKEEKWRKASRWDLLGGIFSVGGVFTSKIDSFLASRAEMRARDAEREARFLAETAVPRPVAETRHDEASRALAGGPPTREEIYEAEMHPWPHHGMADTIEHHRGLRKDPVDPPPKSDPPDTIAER